MVKLSSLSFLFALFAFSASAALDPIAPFRAEIAASPAAAPAIITRALRGGGPNASSLAAPLASAAIENLGPKPDIRRISAIVYAAVHAAPQSVLDIVQVAVATAPKAGPEIAATAATAVPNPWKEVRYHRRAPSTAPLPATGEVPGIPVPAPAPVNRPMGREKDFKDGKDAKDMVDAKDAVEGANQNAPTAPYDPGDPGDPMTLAEAIVLTAFNAQTGIPLSAFQTAVDGALLGDPGVLFKQINSPQAISGVGDAGTSNFANEPLIPPSTPKPPVVSR
jgi:hypothetical protein